MERVMKNDQLFSVNDPDLFIRGKLFVRFL